MREITVYYQIILNNLHIMKSQQKILIITNKKTIKIIKKQKNKRPLDFKKYLKFAHF